MEPLLNLSVIIRMRGPGSWLDKALTGFALQASRDFEVIVADAAGLGSIAELVAGRVRGYPVSLRHVRPGEGRGRDVLAQALRRCSHDYVLLTDADCIPGRDLVRAHVARARRGAFLSGGCCHLDAALGRRISRNDIVRGRCFELAWLQARGHMAAPDRRRLQGMPMAVRLLEAVSPVPFNPRNASAWKEDLLAACGDSASAAGEAGGELASRLSARGIRGRRLPPREAVCLVLGHGQDHAPPRCAQVAAAVPPRPHVAAQTAAEPAGPVRPPPAAASTAGTLQGLP